MECTGPAQVVQLQEDRVQQVGAELIGKIVTFMFGAKKVDMDKRWFCWVARTFCGQEPRSLFLQFFHCLFCLPIRPLPSIFPLFPTYGHGLFHRRMQSIPVPVQTKAVQLRCTATSTRWRFRRFLWNGTGQKWSTGRGACSAANPRPIGAIFWIRKFAALKSAGIVGWCFGNIKIGKQP